MFRGAGGQQTLQFNSEKISVRHAGDDGAQVQLESGAILSSTAFRHGSTGVSVRVNREAGTVYIQGGSLARFGVVQFDLGSSPSIKFKGGALSLALRPELPTAESPYEPPFTATKAQLPPRFFVVRAPATMSGLWAPRSRGANFQAFELLRDEDVQDWIDAAVGRQEEWSVLPEERTKLTLRDSIIRRIFVRTVPTSSSPLAPLLPEPLCIANEKLTSGPPQPQNVGRNIRMVSPSQCEETQCFLEEF